MPIVQRDVFKCARCGHEWLPRGGETPTRCAKCKSPYWHKPRQDSKPAKEPVRIARIEQPDNVIYLDQEEFSKSLIKKYGDKITNENIQCELDLLFKCSSKDSKKEIKKTA